MDQYALYYVNPDTGERLACISGRRMDFEGDQPVLFASAKAIEKCLRDYKRVAVDYYFAQGYRQYLADRLGCELPGADSLDNFRIVKMKVEPDLSTEYTYQP